MIQGFGELLERVPGLVVVNLYPMNRERVAEFARACAGRGRRFLMEPLSSALAGWRDVLGDLDAVRFNPERYCVQLPFESLPLLIDLEAPPGSVYVHSDGAPLGSFNPAWQVMLAWVERMGLEFVRLHSSGHSYPEDVAHVVRAVNPGVVVPVHSRAPEALVVEGVRRLLPEESRPYTAAELKTSQ